MSDPNFADDTQLSINAEQLVKKHEGYNQFPYADRNNTVAIGYGTNFSVRGMSEFEAAFFLHRDISRLTRSLSQQSFWPKLNDARRVAIIDLTYCLGLHGLFNFRQMLSQLACEDWSAAANSLLASEFASQSPNRAHEDAHIIETGRLMEDQG